MKLVERREDVITGSSDLEDLYTLEKFPVFMGSVLNAASEDLVEDMAWSISRDSGFIQLKKLLPLEVLYQSQTTTSAVGETWMAHHRAFSKFIKSYNPSSVLELGGAHGILAREYQELSDIPWTILEPNPSPVEGCKAKFIKGFFNSSFKFDGPKDVIVHSHVFEHMYEPNEFVSHLSVYMKNGQKMIFAVPNLLEWLKRKYTNCINFEHSIFLTEPYIDYLLSKHGFRIDKKHEFMDGHSIFYQVTRDSEISEKKLPENLYESNKQIFKEFVDYHVELISNINARIDSVVGGGPVYLFGAHIFSQYLIAFGLNASRITCLLDNDKNKQGKRLYGTNLSVESPSVLAEDVRPTVILRAGIYNDEIKKDIVEKINKNTVFLE